MKYVIALIATAGVILFWAMLSAEVGWDHGGGTVGMLFMWAVIAGIWGTIMAMSSSKSTGNSTPSNSVSNLPQNNESVTSPQNEMTPPSSIDDSAFYEKAMNECEGGSDTRQLSIWAKAISLTEGDEQKAKAKYIKLRVAELIRQEMEIRDKQEVEKRKEIERQRKENVARQREIEGAKQKEAHKALIAQYPVVGHFPKLYNHFGHRVSRISSESDASYAARLQRFIRDYEDETGTKLV